MRAGRLQKIVKDGVRIGIGAVIGRHGVGVEIRVGVDDPRGGSLWHRRNDKRKRQRESMETRCRRSTYAGERAPCPAVRQSGCWQLHRSSASWPACLQCSLQYFPKGPPLLTWHSQAG